VSEETLVAVAELVDVVPRVCASDVDDAYRGVVLETGRLVIHAAEQDGADPLCGVAQRRALPTGWNWRADLPPHLERCPACEAEAPL
jgi:hypothetical protein